MQNLTPEELQAFNNDLKEICAKHNVVVTAQIVANKKAPEAAEPVAEPAS